MDRACHPLAVSCRCAAPWRSVYILTNRSRTVLYTGVTSDLAKRIHQHRTHVDPHSLTARYKLGVLIYYESHDQILEAIEREKQIKG